MNRKNKHAVLILHEIYGINSFIKTTCQKFQNTGFDVYCPDMMHRQPFPYEESQEAYKYFMKAVGFDESEAISVVVVHLQKQYEKVFLVGFSAGATLAWKCCENMSCDAIVGCYGSRIRDYTQLNPVCPTFLLFSREDSFNVDTLVSQLQGKSYLEIIVFNAKHGFIDPFSPHYDKVSAQYAERLIFEFLSRKGL